ncbi:hypothetical protein DFH06DRAFT_1338164 [Mycena polygramma]|nr:hypothetical protein DFH06DRAFT_1338164 [Mycena polygramma]
MAEPCPPLDYVRWLLAGGTETMILGTDTCTWWVIPIVLVFTLKGTGSISVTYDHGARIRIRKEWRRNSQVEAAVLPPFNLPLSVLSHGQGGRTAHSVIGLAGGRTTPTSLLARSSHDDALHPASEMDSLPKTDRASPPRAHQPSLAQFHPARAPLGDALDAPGGQEAASRIYSKGGSCESHTRTRRHGRTIQPRSSH